MIWEFTWEPPVLESIEALSSWPAATYITATLWLSLPLWVSRFLISRSSRSDRVSNCMSDLRSHPASPSCEKSCRQCWKGLLHFSWTGGEHLFIGCLITEKKKKKTCNHVYLRDNTAPVLNEPSSTFTHVYCLYSTSKLFWARMVEITSDSVCLAKGEGVGPGSPRSWSGFSKHSGLVWPMYLSPH